MVIYWCLEHTSKQVLPKDYKPYLIAFSLQYFVVAAVPSNALGSFGSWRCWNEPEGSVRCVELQSWREKKRTGPAGGDTVSWEEAAGDGWPQGETSVSVCMRLRLSFCCCSIFWRMAPDSVADADIIVTESHHQFKLSRAFINMVLKKKSSLIHGTLRFNSWLQESIRTTLQPSYHIHLFSKSKEYF